MLIDDVDVRNTAASSEPSYSYCLAPTDLLSAAEVAQFSCQVCVKSVNCFTTVLQVTVLYHRVITPCYTKLCYTTKVFHSDIHRPSFDI